jgi:hypothetical protein
LAIATPHIFVKIHSSSALQNNIALGCDSLKIIEIPTKVVIFMSRKHQSRVRIDDTARIAAMAKIL